MKKIMFFALLTTTCFISKQADAQVKVDVNINVGTQPGWGPSGYDYVDYYYIPDVDVYYYVPKHQFIYFESGRWIFAGSLPARCRSYDLYRGYKVILNEPRPYLHHDIYHGKYAKYRGYYDHQPPLHGHGNGKHGYENEGHGNGHGHAYGHDKHHKNDD